MKKRRYFHQSDKQRCNFSFFTTDCASDVCKVARLTQKFMFPCLCHIINLIVRRFVLNLDQQTLELDDIYEYNDGVVKKKFCCQCKEFCPLGKESGKNLTRKVELFAKIISRQCNKME